MREVQFVTPLHVSSKRDYLARMNAEKPECMRVAKQWGYDYWDGERRFGYGGFKYDGRYASIAKKIIEYYNLKIDDAILDIGCGKGFLLYELGKLFSFYLHGIDISTYAICDAELLFIREAEKPYFDISNATKIPYAGNQFDFTYSINTFHNLKYYDLKQAIKEMIRVTSPDGKSYICVESYRTEEELTNLQAWQLTCLSYYSPDDWLQIYEDCGYKGDYEFIFFT